MTDTRRQLLELLKRNDRLKVQELTSHLGVTEMAVRQLLDRLSEAGLVDKIPLPSSGRGRPPSAWQLSDDSRAGFPDRHADLTVELISAIRATAGEDGLERIIAERARQQLDAYRSSMSGDAAARVEALGTLRSAEGYMAEVTVDGDDFLLIEHHCPIREAATHCEGLCRAELALFRAAVGDAGAVERERHLLSGDARCVFRITASTTP